MSKIMQYLLEQQEQGKGPLLEMQKEQDEFSKPDCHIPEWQKMQEQDAGYIKWLEDYNQAP